MFCFFVAIQFIRPDLKNPPVTADLNVPPEVKQIIRTSCYNCHSNETRLPWFDHVAPAYWLVAKDVNEARKHLNFSEFDKRPVAQQKAILYEAVNQIRLGAMPLPRYRRVHPESAITPEQIAVLEKYLNPAVPAAVSSLAETAAADKQFTNWIHSDGAARVVEPAPNGIAFLPEYKNWKAISSTERMDNHSMREILGNDVAIQAIEAGQIDPWPDGTKFAKVAWDQLVNPDGSIHTGQFKQVEFMIKDSRKYASTDGWGFARWIGMDLQPFGKTSDFTTSCVSCHAPMRANDFVFTTPLKSEF